ncbi:MAG: hypothetical protein JNM86_08335 [Phycisphaerae bacterium]|nr:hypothetical protein [Phycisphaerae bacterium]MBN8597340.1 hypothetical protein [Planctomycetota bacterium]
MKSLLAVYGDSLSVKGQGRARHIGERLSLREVRCWVAALSHDVPPGDPSPGGAWNQ